MSCSAKKDANGTWHIQFRYTDWAGNKHKSQKRGFKTKKEAEEWYHRFMLQQASDPSMLFRDFWEIYLADMKTRLRKTTIRQKRYIAEIKILPYFGDMPLNEITAPQIRKWQNEIIKQGYKPTYLKRINNELNAIMNYAVNYYDLKSNPCRKAGSMGKAKADEREYWSVEEFNKFTDAIVDKHDSWVGFQILFWTGIRIGELLALKVEDFDFDKNTMRIDESYTVLEREEIIDAPKTESSFRTIILHTELTEIVREYIGTLYKPKKNTRLFEGHTKHFFEKELKRGITNSGVKKVVIHGLRHSHASILVQQNYNPVDSEATGTWKSADNH